MLSVRMVSRTPRSCSVQIICPATCGPLCDNSAFNQNIGIAGVTCSETRNMTIKSTTLRSLVYPVTKNANDARLRCPVSSMLVENFRFQPNRCLMYMPVNFYSQLQVSGEVVGSSLKVDVKRQNISGPGCVCTPRPLIQNSPGWRGLRHFQSSGPSFSTMGVGAAGYDLLCEGDFSDALAAAVGIASESHDAADNLGAITSSV